MAGVFTRNAIITFITKGLRLILGIGSSVIIVRTLGAERKGIYSLAVLLPALLIIFFNFGIGPSSIFHIGKKKYSPKEVFGNNIMLALLASFGAYLTGVIIIFSCREKLFPGVGKEYLFLALSIIPFQLLLNFINDILLGLNEIKKYNIVIIIKDITFLFLIIVLILVIETGIKGVIISEIISVLITCGISFFLTKRLVKTVSFNFNISYFKNLISYGLKVYLGNILSFLHRRSVIFIINIILNPTAVGFYSVALALSEKIWLFSKSAGLVLFPKVSSETNKKRLKEFTPIVCRNVLFVITIISVLLFFIARLVIILFYSEKFLDSVLPFQILLIGMSVSAVGGLLSNDLSARGLPMLNNYIAIPIIILNIILNILLVPKLDIAGAAWATTISYTVAFFITVILYSRVSGNKIRDILFIKKSDLRFYKKFVRRNN